jgi:hypothetical protein
MNIENEIELKNTSPNKIVKIRSEIKPVSNQERVGTFANKIQIYRFDLFTGVVDEEGKLKKTRSVGSAYLREGLKTYTVHLKTFLKDQFYLLPNESGESTADYALLTREPSKTTGRKYFWNHVGEAKILGSENPGTAKLMFDLLGVDIYMNLHPIRISEVDATESEVQVELKTA